MKTVRTLAASVAIACLATGALADEAFKSALVVADTLTIATTGNAPPISMVGPDGKLTGFDIALCTKIAEDLGLTANFIRVDFAATIPGLKANRFDAICSAVARTPARLASPDLFMSEPTIENFSTVMVRTDSDIATVEDVRNHKIGVVRGGQEGKLLEELFGGEITLTSYPGFAEELLDLKNGRIDAVAMNFTSASNHASHDPALKVITPGFVKEGVSPYTHGIVVSPNQPELLEAVNARIAAMKADGSLAALEAKWIPGK